VKIVGLDRNTCLALILVAIVIAEIFKIVPEGSQTLISNLAMACVALFNPNHPSGGATV
jgi:hypothetical protein